MAKNPRLTIGIMITKDDLDIAAWFNLMKREGQNVSKWIAGMFAAYEMGEMLDAGAVAVVSLDPLSPSPPKISPSRIQSSTNRPQTLLFGSGQVGTSAPAKKPASKYSYGWTVKGPNGEYVVGSVINVSIARQEILPVIDRVRKDGHQLAPFVKALIRQSIAISDSDRPPSINALNQIFARFLLSQKKPTPTTQPIPKEESQMPQKQQTKPSPEAQAKPKNPLLQYIS